MEFPCLIIFDWVSYYTIIFILTIFDAVFNNAIGIELMQRFVIAIGYGC